MTWFWSKLTRIYWGLILIGNLVKVGISNSDVYVLILSKCVWISRYDLLLLNDYDYYIILQINRPVTSIRVLLLAFSNHFSWAHIIRIIMMMMIIRWRTRSNLKRLLRFDVTDWFCEWYFYMIVLYVICNKVQNLNRRLTNKHKSSCQVLTKYKQSRKTILPDECRSMFTIIRWNVINDSFRSN